MSGSIRGMTGNQETELSGSRYASTEEKPHRRSVSSEEKVAKNLIKGLDSMTFQAAKFTIPIAQAPLAIRHRFLTLVVHLVNVWGMKYDEALWEDDEEMEFLVDAKRIQEALAPFYK